jgi:hypothetical protein
VSKSATSDACARSTAQAALDRECARHAARVEEVEASMSSLQKSAEVSAAQLKVSLLPRIEPNVLCTVPKTGAILLGRVLRARADCPQPAQPHRLNAARAGQTCAKRLDKSLEEIPAVELETARAALETERAVEEEVHTQQRERPTHALLNNTLLMA